MIQKIKDLIVVCAMLFVAFLIMFTVALIFKMVGVHENMNIGISFTYYLAILLCFGSCFYFVVFRRPHGSSLENKGRTILIILGMACSLQLLAQMLLEFLKYYTPSIYDSYDQLSKAYDIGAWGYVGTIVVFCILAPIAEEILFRGMIFTTLRRSFGFWISAVVSAMLFGVYHMNVVQFIYTTALGLMGAYLYEKTGDIRSTILLHVSFNSSSYLLWMLPVGFLTTEKWYFYIVALFLLGIEALLIWFLQGKKESL